MPQKLNKAGQMQDYIPKGNGDASGEYGTSNGTNKNFTTSDKNKANVITENKSVVVENEKAKKERIRKEANERIQELHKISDRIIEKPTKEDKELFDKKMDEYEKWEKENSEKTIDYREYFKDKIAGKYAKKDNKANVIDGDLSGKKEETLVDEKTQKEINDRISGWDNKMRYMMLSRMQSDVKYYLGAGGRSKRDLWAQDEKEHIAYMETLYNGLKEKPEWLSKKELENYKKELLKK